MTAPFTSATEARAFVLGGNARFTIVSKVTKYRYTYRVRASKDKRISFVRLLTEPGHYTYLGFIKNGELRLSSKSKMTTGSLPVEAFAWLLRRLNKGELHPMLEIWHDGHCGRCGRALTVPSSLASGFGPECVLHVHH